MQNITNLLKKYPRASILFIFAHPDDESFVSASLILLAKKLGLKTHLICLTKGGRGLNAYKHMHFAKYQNKNGNLKKIREEELKKAVKILKLNNLILCDYPDAELKESVAL